MHHDLDARYQWLRRATTGRNVLGWLALGFLAGFGYFWYGVWAIIFAPPSLFSLAGVIAAMISVVYTVVLPLFWSMIIPNSPAGRLLQKQTWHVPGQIAIMVLACLLTGVAIRVFHSWLQQPQFDPAAYYPAILAMITAAIFVPALCWSATTPEQFIALYESARIAKQLDQQAQLEDLKFKALHARFCAVVNADMRELTIAQFGAACEEMTTLLATGARQEARRYHALARTFESIYGIELAGARDEKGEDRAILEQYKHVTKLLANAGDEHAWVDQYARQTIDVTPQIDPPAPSRSAPADRSHEARVSHQDAIPASPQHIPALPSPQRPAAPRSAPQRYAAEYATAAQAFGSGVFSVAALAEKLDMNPRTARERLDAWLMDGRAAKSDTKGFFYLTEHEARS